MRDVVPEVEESVRDVVLEEEEEVMEVVPALSYFALGSHSRQTSTKQVSRKGLCSRLLLRLGA